MVLENASPSSELESDTPYSSPDPYDDSSSSKYITIDIKSLPASVPLFGPLFGFTERWQAQIVQTSILAYAKIVKRNLTHDEAQAHAYWTSKANAYASWGPPVGVGASLYRAYKTRHSASTLIWGYFNAERVGIGSVEFLKGQMAKSFWQGLRASCYGAAGYYMGSGLMLYFGVIFSRIGELRDPRLKDFNETVMALMREADHKKRTRRIDPTGQGNKSASDLWKDHRNGIGAVGGQQGDTDDTSPSAGDFNYAAEMQNGDRPSSTDSDTNFARDYLQRQAPERRPQPSMSNAASRYPPKPQESDQSSPFDSYSDSSDTASTTSASVWENIRQKAASNPSSNPPRFSRRRPVPSSSTQEQEREQQEGSMVEDSFTFSGAEEERQYAKDEAQKEFDERVEKERRGGDFGNAERRWGR
ncbi:hypothetical protein MMC14_004463 [Varicellaria rhodocarpa]|nr:hypothetical protein [Varicellaria rhodocarpa]